MTAANEEMTSSVDKVSHLGIELNLDSLSSYAVIVSGGDSFYKKSLVAL